MFGLKIFGFCLIYGAQCRLWLLVVCFYYNTGVICGGFFWILLKNVLFFKILLILRSCFVSNKVKGQISKRVFQEKKPRQIFRKTNISYSLIRTRGKKYSIFGKFDGLCFLETPVLRFTLVSRPIYSNLLPCSNSFAQRFKII